MANVPGINSITGFIVNQPEGTPFEVHGYPVHPAHSMPGEQAQPYPWEVVPMGPYPGMLAPIDGMITEVGNTGNALDAGYLAEDPTSDQTPAYHAAPFPNEGPTLPMAEQLDMAERLAGSTRQLLQSASIHASNLGASLKKLFAPTMLSRQDNWTAFFNPETGNDIVPKIPGSVSNNAGGFGVNDHVSNAYAKVNTYGFNTAHRHRRFATGSVPGNTMWMRPGGRPMVRTFTGLDYNFPLSGAFANDDPGATFGYQGAILQNVPSEYVAPPEPALSSNIVSDSGMVQSVPEIQFF
jgi:hypothetical protein